MVDSRMNEETWYEIASERILIFALIGGTAVIIFMLWSTLG